MVVIDKGNTSQNSQSMIKANETNMSDKAASFLLDIFLIELKNSVLIKANDSVRMLSDQYPVRLNTSVKSL